MTVIENTYFKVRTGGPRLISGLALPPIENGPYKFIDCDFHPALDDELPKYKESGCEFVGCDLPWSMQ